MLTREDKKIYSLDAKDLLEEIDCLKPRKRRHIKFLKARWIYQLDDTDFYLIYVLPKGSYWNPKPSGWFWYRVKRSYGGGIKSIEEADFYEVMDDSNLPLEVLFHIDALRKLKPDPIK